MGPPMAAGAPARTRATTWVGFIAGGVQGKQAVRSFVDVGGMQRFGCVAR